MNDVQEYSVDTNTWTTLDDGSAANSPGGRVRHASLFFGGRLYVHGGQIGQSRCPADAIKVPSTLHGSPEPRD